MIFALPGAGAGRRRTAALTGALAALVLAACTLIPASASAAPPPDFVGLQSWYDPSGTDLNRMRSARVRIFRMQINWDSVERTRGSYTWGRYDRLFAMAAARNVSIMPVLLGSPRWAASKPQYPPMTSSSRTRFRLFARKAVERYGPSGTFWATRSVPSAVRARYWQVWNEPNLPNYWNGRPNPAQYASLLKGTSDAIKAGSPSASVLLAGMPWGARPPYPPEFLRRMLAADPAVATKFDFVAIHPYARTPGLVIDGVKQTRRALRGTSASARKIWLTEIGWASGRPDNRFQVSESTQGRYLELAYRDLLRIRDSYRVSGAIWFNLRDRRGADWWAERTGLVRSNGTYKPAWYRLKCVTGAPGCRR